ncbi:hypothetical protein ACCO45_012608 [Purpureocillium lilacinum]|uniref:Uncharacterized protein n=1 Tax=Purpureocillium lilacinum TaxID=33203 RepID=A0ACC4D8F4_PURLI
MATPSLPAAETKIVDPGPGRVPLTCLTGRSESLGDAVSRFREAAPDPRSYEQRMKRRTGAPRREPGAPPGTTKVRTADPARE